MREQNDRESAPTENRDDQLVKAEQKKKVRPPRDSLIEDNPLICRGID